MSAWTCRQSDGKADGKDCSTSSSNPHNGRALDARFRRRKHEPRRATIDTVVEKWIKIV